MSILTDFTPKHEYLVGIDSDGCAFDTMELKHKECFIPNIINYYELQGVSKYAREAAEFVNLYSKSRGINRFPALIETLRVAAEAARGEGPRRRDQHPAGAGRVDQARDEAGQSGAGGGGRRRRSDPDLQQGAGLVEGGQRDDRRTWSAACRRFRSSARCLEKLQQQADMLVVSATPQEALQREWEEHDLTQVRRRDLRPGSRHEERMLWPRPSSISRADVLMIGDAPGDYKAAKANQTLFFPINPGAEDSSWKRFYEEGIDRFLRRHVCRRVPAAVARRVRSATCPNSRRGRSMR